MGHVCSFRLVIITESSQCDCSFIEDCHQDHDWYRNVCARNSLEGFLLKLSSLFKRPIHENQMFIFDISQRCKRFSTDQRFPRGREESHIKCCGFSIDATIRHYTEGRAREMPFGRIFVLIVGRDFIGVDDTAL